jgi:hypothetical protein
VSLTADSAAAAIVNQLEPGRRRAWLDFLDRSRAAATTPRELELALQLNAVVTTRVRELSTLRKVRAPWDIPPPHAGTSTPV